MDVWSSAARRIRARCALRRSCSIRSPIAATFFEPQVYFQFAAKSGGTVADRVHVNLDYDTQREFDASNNISIYYEGKGSEFVQRLEVGNVTFQPPSSRYITAGIPSGNYGIQAVTKLGSMRLKTILAQQKGYIVHDRVFTVGDRTLQAIDRKIEDYQFESRRFFFTVDPRLFGAAYPNVDILDTRRMESLSASLPDTLRPTKIFLYRLLIGGQPPNPNGPQFRLIGNPRSRRGQVYEYLREGVDYYADPSLLWIALVRPLALNNERLVVAYRVRINGRDTVYTSTGGTPDLDFTPTREQFANLIWDPDVQPGDPAFDREIRSVYRLGGADLRRQSVTLKVVTGVERGPGEAGGRNGRHLPQAVRPRAGNQQLELRPREPRLAASERSQPRAEPRLARRAHDSRPVPDFSIGKAVRGEWTRQRRQSHQRHDLHDSARIRTLVAETGSRVPHPGSISGRRQRGRRSAHARNGAGSAELRAAVRGWHSAHSWIRLLGRLRPRSRLVQPARHSLSRGRGR